MIESAARFEGLAEAYDVYRPHYPQALFDDLATQAPQAAAVIDVGAGTGISTRQLHEAFGDRAHILAVEPSSDMRRVLRRNFAGLANVQPIDGTAETLPTADASAALVAACTAFHWFSPQKFFAEAHRVLVPDGIIAVIRNRRAETPMLKRMDAYIADASPEDLDRLQKLREPSVREMNGLNGFRATRSTTLNWQRPMHVRDLISMYLTRSVSVPVVHSRGLGRVLEDLHQICADEGFEDTITLTYETTLKMARKA